MIAIDTNIMFRDEKFIKKSQNFTVFNNFLK
jgi:hypothetical protein